jgi:hypothetical protein
VCHQLRQAKFAYGGSVDFKLEPIFASASAASKNGARFKGGQVDSKIIVSLPEI